MIKDILKSYTTKYILILLLCLTFFPMFVFAYTSYGEGPYGSAIYNDGDTISPSGGSITYLSGYTTESFIFLTVDDGIDSDSGIDASTRIIRRSTSILSNGNCVGFGPFTNISSYLNGLYPSFIDIAVSTSHCYRYEYLVSDTAGNQTEYITTDIVKVDTVKPEGSFKINDGESFTDERVVDLYLEAFDFSSNVVSVIISENSSFTLASWEQYATNKSLTLSEKNGEKTIYVKFKDGAGNISEVLNQSILLEKDTIYMVDSEKEADDTNVEEDSYIKENNEDTEKSDNIDTEVEKKKESKFSYLYVVVGSIVLFIIVIVLVRKKSNNVN